MFTLPQEAPARVKRKRGARTASKTCDCGHAWCTANEADGLHRVPKRKDQVPNKGRRGDLWISRVCTQAEVTSVTQRWEDGDPIFVARHHLYPVDLRLPTGPGGYVTIGSTTFDKDPRFRSKAEIEAAAEAPLSELCVPAPNQHTDTSHQLPTSTTTRHPSGSTSRRSSDNAASDRRRALHTLSSALAVKDPQLRARALEAVERSMDERVATLEAQLNKAKSDQEKAEDLQAAAEDATLLSFKKMISEPGFPVKSYTGFEDGPSLEAFYDLLNHSGQAERLILYISPTDLHMDAEERARRANEKRGATRSLLPEDSLVLTLTVLRTDNTFVTVAPLFGVSHQTASRHFATWLSYLDTALTAMFP